MTTESNAVEQSSAVSPASRDMKVMVIVFAVLAAVLIGAVVFLKAIGVCTLSFAGGNSPALAKVDADGKTSSEVVLRDDIPMQSSSVVFAHASTRTQSQRHGTYSHLAGVSDAVVLPPSSGA